MTGQLNRKKGHLYPYETIKDFEAVVRKLLNTPPQPNTKSKRKYSRKR